MPMFIFGAEWTDLLAYNFRIVGALWAAWAGGAKSMNDAMMAEEDETVPISTCGHIGAVAFPPSEPEPEPSRPTHLKLVN